jgi:hypothetical protein
MSKDRLITKPPKGTKTIPDVVHRNITPIVDIWRQAAPTVRRVKPRSHTIRA